MRRPSTFPALLSAALAALLACALSGCGQSEPPPNYKSYLPADVNAPPKTPMKLTLVSTIDPRAGALRSIAIDRQDRLYALGASGVRILAPDGSGLGAWSPPEPAFAIAADDCGTIYVGLANRIIKYDLSGKELGGWTISQADPGRPSHITSIATVRDSVYVADAGNACVHAYTANGDFKNDIGKRDLAAGIVGLVLPSPYLDVVVDNQDRLVVTNPGRLHVETYLLSGVLESSWGRPGLAPDQFEGCCNPTNLALTREGWVVTSEKGILRVKVSDRAGKLLAYLPPGTFGAKEPGMDLAVDSRNRIYVAATDSGKILVFELSPSGEAP